MFKHLSSKSKPIRPLSLYFHDAVLKTLRVLIGSTSDVLQTDPSKSTRSFRSSLVPIIWRQADHRCNILWTERSTLLATLNYTIWPEESNLSLQTTLTNIFHSRIVLPMYVSIFGLVFLSVITLGTLISIFFDMGTSLPHINLKSP